MTIKETITRTRPSILVPWFRWGEDFANYRNTNYIITGRIVQTITSSADGLTDVIEKVYKTEDDYNQEKTDPVLTGSDDDKARFAYLLANGITWTISTSTY